jgi:hypothetical protein
VSGFKIARLLWWMGWEWEEGIGSYGRVWLLFYQVVVVLQ